MIHQRTIQSFMPLIVPISDVINRMKTSFLGTEERPTAFREFPSAVKETIETGRLIPQPLGRKGGS